MRINPLTNMYVATLVAIGLGGAIAMIPNSAKAEIGKGGMLLWPLFGATNQLLAGFAFLVTAFYLWRRSKPVAIRVDSDRDHDCFASRCPALAVV